MSEPLLWTAHLMRAFYSRGVRHIYLSPGSRSTPLVLGAAIHPGFRHHVVLDERSAAFQALGSGKATGIPALLICTSGTAAANYLPAVVEARRSGIPLILLTADRPPHLRGNGSSQTIDQLKLFGDHALWFHELGEPSYEGPDLDRLDLLARQSVEIAIRQGGAVHLNAAFRKPLEPSQEAVVREEETARRQVKEAENPDLPGTIVAGQPLLHREYFSPELIRLINQSRRPLLLAGPDEPFRTLAPLAERLSHHLGIPAIVEPGSHCGRIGTVIRHPDIFLGGGALNDALRPDLIIRIGSRPFTAAGQLLESAGRRIPVIHLHNRDRWDDLIYPKDTVVRFNPENTLALARRGNPTEELSVENLAKELTIENLEDLEPKGTEWLAQWISADEKAQRLLKERMEEEKILTDGHAVRHFTSRNPEEWMTICSNSMTVRDLALFSGRKVAVRGVHTNRGAAGIDGILSTGVGIGRATGRPVRILTGDLALLHDSNALLALREPGHRVVIGVINNGGGTIFRHLPVNDGSDRFRRFFETPQQVNLASLARAHGVEYIRAESIRELSDRDGLLEFSDADEVGKGPALLIEYRTDPDGSETLRRTLWREGAKLV